MARTWKDDLQGIEFKFLKHSVPEFSDIHMVMNDLYKAEVEGDSFHELFTDKCRDILKPNCASLLLDTIWIIVTNQATATDKADYLKNIITSCKTKFAIIFSVLGSDNTTWKKYLHAICGDEMGKGLIQDLLNHTTDNTTKAFASIEFHINKLYFIPGFIPEDLCGMAFTPLKPVAPTPVATPATTTTGTPATPTATAAGPSPLNTPKPNFNASSLPTDVQQRYKPNKAANSVMTSADMGTFLAQPVSPNNTTDPSGNTMC